MVNHADHVFWLGVENASLIMCLREICAEASITARGYPAGNVVVAPTPLPDIARRLPSEAAKRQLGIDPSQVVLLTLAAQREVSARPMAPGLRRGRRARDSRIAAGDAARRRTRPDGYGPGASLARDMPARVLVPGAQPDPSVYLDAADIYLDSFPFASITSMLEAATRDVPIMTSRAYAGMSRLMEQHGAARRRGRGRGERGVVPPRAGPAGRRRRPASSHGRADRRGRALAARDRGLALAPAVPRRPRPRRRSGADAVVTEEHDQRDLNRYAEALLGIEMRAPLLWTIRRSGVPASMPAIGFRRWHGRRSSGLPSARAGPARDAEPSPDRCSSPPPADHDLSARA